MSDDQHYDVIIIGTGAGGGTLAHRLAPTGKRVLLLERGGLPAAGAGQLGLHRGLRHGQVPRTGVLVRPARRRVPAGGQLLRRRQHQVLRRGAVPAAARGLRRAPPPRRHLAGLADRLRRPGAVLHPGRAPVPGARPARRGPDRGAGQRAVRATRRSSTSRGSSSSATTWRSRACTRSTCRSASTSTQDDARPGHPRQRLHPLRPGRRVPLPGRRQVRRPGDLRRPGAGARQRRAGDQRPRAAAGDRPDRPHGHRGRRRARRRRRPVALQRRHRRGRLRRGELRRRCCCARPTTGTRTGWPTARTWSAATTCGTTTWR